MPTKTWVVGEEVLAADFNTYVQRQVVPTFANTAARNTALPSPTPGMLCYVTDLGWLQEYTAKTSPPSWQRPWNSAWGLIQSSTCSQPNTPGPIYITGAAFSLPYAGRAYKITFRCMAGKDGTAANVRYQININNAMYLYAEQPMPAGQVWSCEITAHANCATNGIGGGVVVQVFGASNVDTSWGRVLVEDVGPAV